MVESFVDKHMLMFDKQCFIVLPEPLNLLKNDTRNYKARASCRALNSLKVLKVSGIRKIFKVSGMVFSGLP